MRNEVLRLLYKYRIPPSELKKEVLVDRDLLQEIPDDIHFPFAFPGLPFKFVHGVAWEEGRKAEAVEKEYGVEVRGRPLEFSGGERLYLEAPPERARDVLVRAAVEGYKTIVGVCRERLGVILTAEPGWPEYSPLTVLFSLLYDVEAYRLPAQAFFPHPRGSMAWIEARREREIEDPKGFFRFLQRLFKHKKKKLSNLLPVDDERRVVEVPPKELLKIYELIGGE